MPFKVRGLGLISGVLGSLGSTRIDDMLNNKYKGKELEMYKKARSPVCWGSVVLVLGSDLFAAQNSSQLEQLPVLWSYTCVLVK